MATRMICSIFRSSRRAEMYLYVPKTLGVSKVPEALMEMFGRSIHVMDMLLTPERSLARADTTMVLTDMETKGYYLQMPPPEESIAVTEFGKRLDTDNGGSA